MHIAGHLPFRVLAAVALLACALTAACALNTLQQRINGTWDMADAPGESLVIDLHGRTGTMTHIRTRPGKAPRRDVLPVERAEYLEREGVARLIFEKQCLGHVMLCYQIFMEIHVRDDGLLLRCHLDGWDDKPEDFVLTPRSMFSSSPPGAGRIAPDPWR